MTLYVDSSALTKKYVAEPDSGDAMAILERDLDWTTANHTYVEVRLVLARRLAPEHLPTAIETFERDWDRILVVQLNQSVCRRAAEIGTSVGVRTLDALHLAAAERVRGDSLPIATFDVRLADAARTLGFAVLGS